MNGCSATLPQPPHSSVPAFEGKSAMSAFPSQNALHTKAGTRVIRRRPSRAASSLRLLDVPAQRLLAALPRAAYAPVSTGCQD